MPEDTGKDRKGKLVKLILTDKEKDLIIKIASESINSGNLSVDTLESYRAVKDIINLERIELRERKRQHDVYGKIEEFNYLADVYFRVKEVLLEEYAKADMLKKLTNADNLSVRIFHY